MTRSSHLLLSALSVLTIAALAGCAPEVTPPAPSASPPGVTSSEAPPPTPTPTESAQTETIAFPGTCDDLLTAVQLDDATGFEWTASEQTPSTDDLPGPLARQTASSALESLACTWQPAVAQDGFANVYAFRLEQPAKDTLIAGLRDAPATYSETEIDGNLSFRATESNEMFTMQIGYLFIDDVWVALHAPLFEEATDEILPAIVSNVAG